MGFSCDFGANGVFGSSSIGAPCKKSCEGFVWRTMPGTGAASTVRFGAPSRAEIFLSFVFKGLWTLLYILVFSSLAGNNWPKFILAPVAAMTMPFGVLR